MTWLTTLDEMLELLEKNINGNLFSFWEVFQIS